MGVPINIMGHPPRGTRKQVPSTSLPSGEAPSYQSLGVLVKTDLQSLCRGPGTAGESGRKEGPRAITLGKGKNPLRVHSIRGGGALSGGPEPLGQLHAGSVEGKGHGPKPIAHGSGDQLK